MTHADHNFRERLSFGPQPESPAKTEPFSVGLFVACYDEERNIAGTLATVVKACRRLGLSFEIVVIDDASHDDSVKEVKHFAAEHPDVPLTLCVNSENQGLAHNYATAAFLCRSEWYRLICGDNVEPEETLVAILSQIGQAEVIIPYQTEVTGRALSRVMLSKAYTQLVNLLSGHRLHYYNGLAVTRRHHVMRWHSHSTGFGFQADLVTRLLWRGLSFREVAVQARERPTGQSKAITLRNFCSVANTLLGITIRRISRALFGRR